ncbi:MAG: GAF domain-containing protein [Anaerolineae bacterium]|nr:GAF domain-containing protein [Anaerolineae bacterium]
MNYIALTTPEFMTASIAALVFGFSVILAALRLRSKESVIFYLLLYMGLGLWLGLVLLADALNLPTFISGVYRPVIEFTLLAMVLAFGVLTLNFTRKSRKVLIWYWAAALLILLLWALFIFNFFGLEQITVNLAMQMGLALYQLGTPAVIMAGLGWIVAIGVALVTLSLEFRKRKYPTQYLNKLRYWLIVIILLTSGGLVIFWVPIFAWAGVLLLTIAGILIAYTVLSYHTPDLRILMGRAIRYALITLILFAILFFSLAGAALANRNVFYPNAVLLWSTALAALVLAILLPPLWRGLDRILTRIIFGKQHHDQKQIIKRYSRSISSVLDMNRLGDTIINLMIETLGIERGIVFVNERGGGGNISFRPLSSVGMTNLTTGQFAADSPFIYHLRKGEKVLSQYDINMQRQFRQMNDDEREWLAGLNMELYVPILRQPELVGLLAFGPQSQGTSYYEEDVDLMISLADQAALAIDSARLFDQLSFINQEVGQLTDQLAGLDQDKSDFLSIASHELRTPLTHIHGYSRMLLDLTEEELQDPAYVKTIIEGIAKGSDRMKDVVDLMFDVTEADVGDINLFVGPVVLLEVIDQAARSLLPALDERRIAFQKINLKELPTVEADGTRLMQAFENLIGNAIKYTPDGGMITVEGRATVLDNIGPAVEIVVADTGIGIDPKYHERIFEKFFRVDDTAHHSTGKTKFKGAGPGLGLTLVKGIAEAHGGQVWVESLGYDEVNCPGSKFFFVIPLHPLRSQARPQSEIETRHWRKEEAKTNKQIK